MTRRARLLRVAFVIAVFMVLGVMVLPGRLWFGQRNDIAQAQEQLTALRREHRTLETQVATLSSKTLIEQEARASFGWVYPRDEVYNVPAAPPMVVNLPDVWPFRDLQQPLADAAADR